jgi:predicted Zn-dependent peptidase
MVQEHTLKNGLSLLMVPLPYFHSTSIGVFVRIGSRYESQRVAGISHFIEHMLFKGTSRRPTAKLMAEAIEGVGGLSDAYTSQETTVYYAKVAADQSGVAIDFLADLIRNPLFASHDIEKEQQVISEEISMVYDTPDDWINILLDQAIWPDHPLGQNIAGTYQSLANIDRDSLISFFKQSYHPHNLLIALAGEFNETSIVAELAARLEDWEPGPVPQYEPAPEAQIGLRYQVENRPTEQGHLALALPGLARNNPDRYALNVLNTILGDGMSSRLFLSIREDKGLAYAVESGLNFLQDTGTWMIYAGVDPERAPEALQAILDELERLCVEPIPPQELHKAKAYLKGRLVLGLEDSYSQAAWVAYQRLLMNEIKSPQAILAAYDAVTIVDVQAVAERLIKPAGYSLAAIGPFGRGEALVRLLSG